MLPLSSSHAFTRANLKKKNINSYQRKTWQPMKLPHPKIPFLTLHLINQPSKAFRLEVGEVVEVARVLRVVVVVEREEPYEMELVCSFCSSSAKPTIESASLR